VSVFSPLDPRGPDQRRKQLIAKLAGQAGAAQNAVSRIPMPGRMGGAMMAEGRSFHGASTSRLGGAAHVTQSPNILQSVLARLGVVGKSHAEEMSGGRGLPIAPPAPHAGSPLPPPGAAIPISNPVPTQPGPPGLPPGIAQTAADIGTPAPAYQVTPDSAGQTLPEGTDTLALPNGGEMPDLGFYMADGGPVALGNGLYYDPASGTILGQQDVNPTIPAARPGKNVAF
jgi:hypothetical protein